MDEEPTRDNINQDLIDLVEQFQDKFDQLTQSSDKDIEIDEFEIDTESLRTPKLHQKYSVRLAEESRHLIKIQQLQKRIYMERWKYYNGTQKDSYYAKHGLVNHKILKQDIDKHLNADIRLGYANELLEIQKQTVNYLERLIKDIINRGFHIKNYVDYRKFENAVN